MSSISKDIRREVTDSSICAGQDWRRARIRDTPRPVNSVEFSILARMLPSLPSSRAKEDCKRLRWCQEGREALAESPSRAVSQEEARSAMPKMHTNAWHD